MVVFDSVTANLYALDAQGHIFSSPGPSYSSWTPLPTTTCIGGTAQTFVYVVAKNKVVYGLGTHGTVWFDTATNNCWTQVGSKSTFAVSIATDNGETNGVWATDTSGHIWTAD